MPVVSIQDVVNEVGRSLLHYCVTPEEIQEVLEQIKNVDWSELATPVTMLRLCKGCGIRFNAHYEHKRLRHMDFDLPDFLDYCPNCLYLRQSIECPICGQLTPYRQIRDGMCSRCAQGSPQECRRIKVANDRTARLGLESTLTITQWIKTLHHFDNHCAYCQRRPFVAIDHFKPVALGGGTVANNCVPSCKQCNSRKKDYNPSGESPTICPFPKATIKRVANYLSTL